MKTNTREKIREYITQHDQARAHDLVTVLKISHAALHRQLKKMIEDGTLHKVGKPPLVFYIIAKKDPDIPFKISLPPSLLEAVEENFLSITPDGRLLYGIKGFIYWKDTYQKEKRVEELARTYSSVLTKTLRVKQGWIDGTDRLKSVFHDSKINHLFYQDIYSYPLFGRTRLAKLVMHAKQSENKELISKIAQNALPIINKIIDEFDINTVCFIPPTVPRPVQFIHELRKQLSINLPEIDLAKIVPGDIPVPQKSLATVEERIINAQSSIFPRISHSKMYDSILLIDDVAGSGASFHETAVKLHKMGLGKKRVIAFALVGNIKGFDVIRQL